MAPFGIIIALEYWQKKSKNALYYMRNLKKNKSTLEGGGGGFLSLWYLLA